MKKKIIFVLKIVFIVLVVAWYAMFVSDRFRAKNNTKPLICLSETTEQLAEGTYYKCTSLGYKYYEYKGDDGSSFYGFGFILGKSDKEKEIGV